MNSIKNKKNKSINKPFSPLLSVIVSCKGVEKTLSCHLKALKNQNLRSELWQTVFIFKRELESDKNKLAISLIKQFFPVSLILFLEENKPLYEKRNLAFRHLTSPYLYFIDEDVILEESTHLSYLVNRHQESPELAVLGGAYLDHPESSFWGSCYNWLVRLWVLAHKTERFQDLVPAGNLSIKDHKTFLPRFYSPHGFGAEEIYFLRDLHKKGACSYADFTLSAPHLARHSFKDFIWRAWSHGRSLSKQKSGSKRLFFKEPARFSIKIMSLFYLLMVRFSWFWSQLKPLFLKRLDF